MASNYLKTSCQWRELPMGEYFDEPYTHKSVFHHFNKWSKEECWQDAWQHMVSEHKELLDLSNAQLDGTHTPRAVKSCFYKGFYCE
jgi:hypothetical protein